MMPAQKYSALPFISKISPHPVEPSASPPHGQDPAPEPCAAPDDRISEELFGEYYRDLSAGPDLLPFRSFTPKPKKIYYFL